MRFTYFIGWNLCRAVFATYFRWRVYDPERVPAEGAAIIAANHASFIDPLVVGASARRELNYLARDSLFGNPLLAAVLREVNVVPVDREGGSPAGLKAILDRLLADNAIVLFPEGTRTRDGQLQPARAGIGLIVIKSQAPVVPVRVFGTFEAFNRYMKLPRPRRIAVKFGQPLHFTDLRAEAMQCSKPRLKEIYRQVAEEILRAIAALQPCRDVTEF
jgi:1-acyl-sn-glycerol-3-phosphate acyltransferase